MKKALLVVGLCMGASLAFAQTESIRLGGIQDVKMDFNGAAAAEATNYKASIFTKAAGDTIQIFRFTEDEMANITYGSNGEVKGNQTVYSYVSSNNTYKLDTLVTHSQTLAMLHWERVKDSADFILDDRYTSFGQQAYLRSYILSYMNRRFTGDDNGFMLMTMLAAHGSGNIHAWFELPTVPKNPDAALIDIKFTQMYRKYYDRCYIDYKIGDAWYAREINVENIDVEVNSFAPVLPTYTMPVRLAQQDQYILRVRYRSADRGNSYGYAWAIDNFAVVVGATQSEGANRWKANNENYTDGAYGQIPQGFHIPLSWYGTIINNGANDQGGAVATTYTFDANKENAAQLLQVSLDTIYSNPTIEQYAVINERGFMPVKDSIGYAGWFGRGTDAKNNYNSNTITGNYQKRALPTENLGRNYVTTTVTNDNSGVAPAQFDTIAYKVTTSIGGDSLLSVAGYRWSHDNGIIPAGSRYATGYTAAQADGSHFVTDSGHDGDAGYRVYLRYTTPDVIPTDINGDPWVFLGLEIVAQTMEGVDVAADDMVGAEIFPVLNRIDYKVNTTPDSSNFYTQTSIATGASTVVPHSVTRDELIEGFTNGYRPNDAEYKAVNIRFFNMPEIEPNTSYYLGYVIASASKFAAARNLYSYRTSSGAYASYRGESTLAPWASQFTPNVYDTWVFDPANSTSNLFAGRHDNVFPMIRAIVGPRAQIDSVRVGSVCTDDNYTMVTMRSGNQFVDFTGQLTKVPKGSDPTFYIFGKGTYEVGTKPGVVDEIILDGTSVLVSDINDASRVPEGVVITERNENMYDEDSTVIFTRTYYVVTITNVQKDGYMVCAKGHEGDIKVGIEAEAPSVALGLKPNPATSQVSLNIKGVTGTVNCSIIDMSGRVVYSRNLNAEQQHTINLDNIAAGAYFVRVTNDNFSKVEKLIVR